MLSSIHKHYSRSHIVFLDTKVRLQDGNLITELYTKPSASFQCLHRPSYHPPHTFSAIIYSRFIRIRQICTILDDYKKHTNNFISFFKSCGFSGFTLKKTAKEIVTKSRDDLFNKASSLTQF